MRRDQGSPPEIFECVVCGKRFASDELLEAHMAKRHPRLWRIRMFERIVSRVREEGALTFDELAEDLPVSKSWILRHVKTLDEYEDISYGRLGVWRKGEPPDWAFW